ncbi:MAG: hypothetical protein A2W80_03455 [Candidatus Riflebacteria bacterium GWC2_50_8]|nr:MAG: hypothetical protein A2W80_03455 [Candidatus Riflebacteria bacterium GWC2_50_8]
MRTIFTLLFIAALTLLSFPLLAFSPSQVFQQYKLAATLEQKESYVKAVEALAPLYQERPDDYTVNLKLGWLSYLNKTYRNSQFHYEMAAAAAPAAIEPLLGMSLSLMAQGNWADVEQLMHRVLKLDYYNYYANLRLSIALRNQKKYGLAEQIDRRMLANLPANLDFLLELGANLFYQNKLDAAESVFSYILILDFTNLTAQDFIARLKNKNGKR